jgi:hypothetical protein
VTDRDDLEAAQLRAADLERELDALRKHNEKLEAELAGDDRACHPSRLAHPPSPRRLVAGARGSSAEWHVAGSLS